MGLFDSIKNTFGKSEAAADVTVAPSQLLREAPGPATDSSPDPAAEPVAEGESEAEVRTYTVVSGDTLWKISEREYGNGANYVKIFEANTDVLEHPDRIFPGQKLVIPDL